MITLTMNWEGLDKIKGNLNKLEKQIPFALATSINSTAKGIAKAENDEINRVFDRPTPRTANATKVMKFATKTDLQAIVGLDDGSGNKRLNARGFKGTIFPDQYLEAQVQGGSRATKRFEMALIKANVMPAGKQAVFARRSNALDQYGNLPASKIVQMLSWFKAFPEVGYRANMKDKTKQSLMKGKRKGLKWGFSYFRGGRETGLLDGIWERHYPNGTAGKSYIKPILIFVDGSSYKVRLPFESIARRHFDQNWKKDAEQAIERALATAR